MNEPAPHLWMKNISKSFFSSRVLHNVTIEARQGNALALIGANGAGKSTLMNILGGVHITDYGTIVINENAVEIQNPSDAARHNIAFIHKETALLPTMSISDNL